MLLMDRIEFLYKLEEKKQLLFALICAERGYKELVKASLVPNENNSFTETISELWDYMKNPNDYTLEHWKTIFEYYHDNYESKPSEFQFVFLEMVRVVNFVLSMIIWGNDTHKISAGTAEKVRKIISLIYDDDSREFSMKELEWLTKALHLIAESGEFPASYQWFLDRIPDYIRGTVHRKFND
jgi:hypothetical protein